MKRRLIIVFGVLALIILGGIVSWSISQAQKSQDDKLPSGQTQSDQNTDLLVRTDKQGEVEVAVMFLNPVQPNNNYLLFQIDLNTHSVDLEQFNLPANSQLQLDGQRITTGFQLETQGSGHHITYILKVPATNIDLKKVQKMKLLVKNLDNIPERVFVWDLKQLDLK